MNCVVCGASTNEYIVGRTPIAGYTVSNIEESLSQPKFNLKLNFCHSCTFGRYDTYKEAESIMVKVYEEQQSTYSLSRTVERYIDNLADDLINTFNLSDSSVICEVGCNEGNLLSLLKQKTGCDVVGIEPSQHFQKIWEAKDIFVLNEFLTKGTAEKIKRKPDIIILRHILEHIEELDDFIDILDQISCDDTKIIVEVPHFPTVIKNKRIDNIGYQHINYFSLKSIDKLFFKWGYNLIDYKLVETDGGSVLAVLSKGNTKEKKENYEIDDEIKEVQVEKFINYIHEKRETLQNKLLNYERHCLIGYGGGPKGQHLIHLFDLNRFMDVVVNDIEHFHDKYIPGTSISYKKPSEYLSVDKAIDVVAVINLAPTHTETIAAKIPTNVELINIIEPVVFGNLKK